MLAALERQPTVLGRRRLKKAEPVDQDALAYISRCPGGAGSWRAAVNRYFLKLKSVGAYPFLRAGYLFAGPDQAGALANIAGLTSRDAVISGAPSFTPYKGLGGIGAGQSLVFNGLTAAAVDTGAAGYGWQFAGRLDCAQIATEYAAVAPSSVVLTDAGSSVALGLRVYTSPFYGISGQGPAGFGANPLFGAQKMVIGEFGGARCLPRLAFGAGSGAGGGSFQSQTSALRISPNYPLSFPRHAAWLFFGGAMPNLAFQGSLDALSDLMEEIGALVG